MSSGPLVLAFDTATSKGSVALVSDVDGALVAERATHANRLVSDIEELLDEAKADSSDIAAVVVGTGPGRYTSLRMGLATARALSIGLSVPASGVSTLDALGASAGGGQPVIDARRGEVFARNPNTMCVRPEEMAIVEGETYVGDGALEHRAIYEQAGALVPPDDDPRHRVLARYLVGFASEEPVLGELEPTYLRQPDAERTRREFRQA